jgi:uncharacterized protein
MKLADLKGHWALVTGASAGIGEEYAKQLAAAGANVALVARRKSLLDSLASELRQAYAVQTKVIEADLSHVDIADSIRAQLIADGIRIRLLCNNAGIQSWGAFQHARATEHRAMIDVNVAVLVALCHVFHDDLTSHPSSAVINVASPAAYQPVPYLAVYAATKAFVLSFSQALHGEWADDHVSVQAVMPGPTDTPGIRRLGIDVLGQFKNAEGPSRVVRKSLSCLQSPLAMAATGTLLQRFFAATFPSATVIRTAKKMFQPRAIP